MELGTKNLLKTFFAIMVFVIIGQWVRRLLVQTPKDTVKTIIIGKVYVWMTIPCTIFESLYSLSSMPHEAGYLILASTVWLAGTTAIGVLVFNNIPDPKKRASFSCSISGYSTGLYIALMSSLLGTHAVALLILFDVPNNIYTFVTLPYLLIWFKNPSFGQGLRDFMTEKLPFLACFGEREQVKELPPPSGPDAISMSVISSNAEPSKDAPAAPAPAQAAAAQAAAPEKKIAWADMDWKQRAWFVYDSDDFSRLAFNMPIWALILGVIFQLTHTHMPSFIYDTVTIAKNANTFVVYFMLGLNLDVKKEVLFPMIKPVLTSMAIRYVLGTVLGIILYVTCKGTFSATGRLIILFAFVMSHAAPAQVVALQVGANQAVMSNIATITSFISLIIILIMFLIAGIPDVSSSTASTTTTVVSSSSEGFMSA